MTANERILARVVNRELNSHRGLANVKFFVREWCYGKDIEVKFFSYTGKASRVLQNLLPHVQKRLGKTKKAANIKRDFDFTHEYILIE